MTSIIELVVSRIKHVLSFGAKPMRTIRRALLVIFGISLYLAAQLYLAKLVMGDKLSTIALMFSASVIFALGFYRPILVFCIWLFLSPWLKPFFQKYQYSKLSLSFDFCLLGFLAFVLIIRFFAEKKKIQKLSFAEALFLLYALYTAVYSVPIPSSFAPTYIPKLLSAFIATPALTYFIMKGCLSEKKYIVWMMVSVFITSATWVIAAFYEHFTGKMAWSILAGQQIALIRQDVSLGRAQGASGGTAVMGLVLIIGMLFAIHFGKYAKTRFLRGLSYSLLPLLFLAAYFTYTRNTYIGLAVTILFMTFLSIKNKKIYIAAFAVLTIFIAILGPFLMSNKAFNERISDPANVYGRIAMNKAAINMIKHNFWLGTGSVYQHINEYVVDPAHHPIASYSGTFKQRGVPDNEFLFVFAQFGFIGFCLFVGPAFLIVLRLFIFRKRIAPSNNLLSTELLSIIVVYSLTIAVSGNGTSYTSEPYPLFILASLLAMGTKLIYFTQRETTREKDVQVR